jgi:hypothetical protein
MRPRPGEEAAGAMNQSVDAHAKAEDGVGQFALKMRATLCCHTSSVDEMKFARDDCLFRCAARERYLWNSARSIEGRTPPS